MQNQVSTNTRNFPILFNHRLNEEFHEFLNLITKSLAILAITTLCLEQAIYLAASTAQSPLLVADITTNLTSEISSASDINLTSYNDTMLQGAKLKAREDVNINAQNNLLILTATDSSLVTEKAKNKATFHFSKSTNGGIGTDIHNTEIIAGAGSSDPQTIVKTQNADGVVSTADNSAENTTENSANINSASAQTIQPAQSAPTGTTNFNIGNTAYVEYKAGSSSSSSNNANKSASHTKTLSPTEAAIAAANSNSASSNSGGVSAASVSTSSNGSNSSNSTNIVNPNTNSGLMYLAQLDNASKNIPINNSDSIINANTITSNNITTNSNASLFALAENNPYIASASTRIGTTSIGNVLFNPLTEIHDSWNSRNGGLTGAGTAVVIVVVTVAIAASAGAAGAAVAGAAGATTTTVAAGATVATTTLTTTGAFIAAGTAAAITSTATTFAVSAVNNGGKIGQSLKDTTSKESLKNIAISAVAAGATAGVMSGLQSGGYIASSTTAPTQIASFSDLGNSFGNALAKSAVNTTTSVAAQSTLNGDSFKDAMKLQATNILINAVGQVGAEQIGVASHGTAERTAMVDSSGNAVRDLNGNVMTITTQITPATINMPVQLTLHAGLGCAMAAAGGNNCGAGAAAGITGELIGASLRSSVDDGSITRLNAIGLAEVGSALAAAIVAQPDDGNSVFAGSRIGRNAAENNAISAQYHEVATPKKDTSLIKNDSGQIKLGILGIKFGEINFGISGEAKINNNSSVKISANQEVSFESGSYHASWLIVPENQELWKNNDNFKNNVLPDGRVYATVGGGPDKASSEIFKELPNLHGGINRQPYDTDLSNKVLTVQINPALIGSEDTKIQQIFDLNKNYENHQDKLNYWLFPKNNDNFYNSNSYFSGIGQAAGIPIPQTNLNTPGYDKPVPATYFTNPN